MEQWGSVHNELAVAQAVARLALALENYIVPL
jgi:hypothetical protein